MAGPRITVIVLNWNGRHHLQECLDAVLAQDIHEPFDVLVWDNGSTDGSQAFVRTRFPKVRLHDCGENLGFAKAMNQAIAMVQTPCVVLLNNDTRAERDWLRTLVEAADLHPDAAAVGSRLLLWRDRPAAMPLLHHAGAVLSPLGGGLDLGLGEPASSHAGESVGETGAVCGGAALFRRDAFLAHGGFDPAFFLYTEDADFCHRVWLAGGRCLHAPGSVVWHRYGASTRRQSATTLYWGTRTRFASLLKNRARPVLPAAASVGLNLARAAALLARGRPRHAAACLRGTLAGLGAMPAALQQRAAIQARRTVSDKELRRRGLLLSGRGVLQAARQTSKALRRLDRDV
ncbi:MAG: hypothetical protein QOD77_34 [Thermoplasmata archaeon]|jgi:GT2 family glycosyltransferase|nr:hypothetical protein [Thermoplasmata archaeon]